MKPTRRYTVTVALIVACLLCLLCINKVKAKPSVILLPVATVSTPQPVAIQASPAVVVTATPLPVTPPPRKKAVTIVKVLPAPPIPPTPFPCNEAACFPDYHPIPDYACSGLDSNGTQSKCTDPHYRWNMLRKCFDRSDTANLFIGTSTPLPSGCAYFTHTN